MSLCSQRWAPCAISPSPGAARRKRAELTCQKVVAMETSLGAYMERYMESYLYCHRCNPTFYFSWPNYILCCKHLQVSSEKRRVFKEINMCCVLHFESGYQHWVKTSKCLCVGFLKTWFPYFPSLVYGMLLFSVMIHLGIFCHVFKPNHVIPNLTGSEN